MICPRIIARLDIKGPNVIKGIHLEGLRVVGKPDEMARRYYADGVDEIIYMDCVASLYGRNSILPLVEQAAREIFVPLTVGGGIRTIEDIVAALRAGADKVSINTSAVKDPTFIKRAAETFGSQCIVLSVEAKQRDAARWEVLVDNGRERTGRDVIEWVQEAESLGMGEVLITSVDKEGTKSGFDRDLVRRVSDAVSVPVIACGGAGSTDDITRLIDEDDLEAVACASLLHYGIAGIGDIKASLSASGIEVQQ